MKRKNVITRASTIVPRIVILIILTMVVYVGFFKDSERTAPVQTVPQTPTADEKPSNPYLSKYAGEYIIKVLGIFVPNIAEVYILHENGNAKWMWLEDDGPGGVKKVSEKTGTWTAEKNKISINIRGNTGMIKEEFIMKRGIFKAATTKKYLEPTK